MQYLNLHIVVIKEVVSGTTLVDTKNNQTVAGYLIASVTISFVYMQELRGDYYEFKKCFT